VIISNQLLTKQFSMNIIRAEKSEAVCKVVLENITDYAYSIILDQLKVCKWIHRKKTEDTNSQILTLQNTCEYN